MDLISLTAFIHWIYLQVYTTFTQFHSQDSQHQSSSLMIRLFCNSSFFHEFFLLLDISWFVEVVQTLNVIRLEVASFICCFISIFKISQIPQWVCSPFTLQNDGSKPKLCLLYGIHGSRIWKGHSEMLSDSFSSSIVNNYWSIDLFFLFFSSSFISFISLIVFNGLKEAVVNTTITIKQFETHTINRDWIMIG